MRYFTVAGSGTNFEGGRYASKDNVIGTAARKAGARLYRNLTDAQIQAREKKGQNGIKFILRETTRGSKKNTYYFLAKRDVLTVPVVITKKADLSKDKGENEKKANEANKPIVDELRSLLSKAKDKTKSDKITTELKKLVGENGLDPKDSKYNPTSGGKVGYLINNKYVIKSIAKCDVIEDGVVPKSSKSKVAAKKEVKPKKAVMKKSVKEKGTKTVSKKK